jgi:hypothetical protein
VSVAVHCFLNSGPRPGAPKGFCLNTVTAAPSNEFTWALGWSHHRPLRSGWPQRPPRGLPDAPQPSPNSDATPSPEGAIFSPPIPPLEKAPCSSTATQLGALPLLAPSPQAILRATCTEPSASPNSLASPPQFRRRRGGVYPLLGGATPLRPRPLEC